MTSAPTPEAVSPLAITPAEAGMRAAWAEAQPKSVPVDRVIHGDCKQVLRQLPDAADDSRELIRYTGTLPAETLIKYLTEPSQARR
jgi:hypothetical protein